MEIKKERYKRFFKKIEESKKQYQNELLNSSFLTKLSSLIRIQEKALFFKQIKQKFDESFDFPKIIDIIEDLKDQNLIQDYCLGGATALLYYSTPHLTEDIDIFIELKRKSLIYNLSDIYQYLKDNYQAVEKGEFILIKGFPVQFLLAGNQVTQEAFDEANYINISGKKFKIFSLEYLIAIMLYLGKSKYKERLRIVKEEQKYDENILNKLLQKYNLINKWNLIQ